jgi:hypothetical protein
LSFVTIVADSNHTTLLATATGTSDNNNITDSSSNSHSITVNGDTYAGSFSPYRSGGYSVHLNDGEEISFPDSSNYNISNGSFSIEAWVYPTSYDSPWSGVISQFSSSSRGWGLAFSSTQITFLGSTNGGSSTNVIGSVTSSVPLNQWTHLLVTRDSNTIRIFNNGVLVNNFTESGTFNNSTNPLRIGELNSAASENFRGYIRDARVVKGSVPTEYQTSSTTNSTTIFSVPSEPLTAVTNTVLLTCHLPYISDGSANDATPTLSGNVSTKPFSPYDYTEYSATDHGGSVYFDVTGDYITATGIDLSSARTIEFWYYKDSNSTALECIFSIGNGYSDNVGVSFYTRSGDFEFRVGSTIVYDSGASLDLFDFTWHHIAIVISSSNSADLYINGSRKYSGSNVTRSNSMPISIGSSVNGLTWNNTIEMQGFISDFAIFNSAKYSGTTLTVPTAPLSSSGSELHIKGTDASIIDKSQGSNLKLIGNTTGSTTQVKFANTKSMYFDGTTDHIISQEPVLLGTQEFTAECWVYYQSGLELMGNRTTSDSGGFSVRMTATSLTVGNSSGSGFGSVFSGTTSSLTNAWHHIAVSRSSGITKIYVDGSSIASYSSTINFSLSNPFVIGYAYSNGSGSDSLQGYIQDFRITKGLARYTATFTPPTTPLEG